MYRNNLICALRNNNTTAYTGAPKCKTEKWRTTQQR